MTTGVLIVDDHELFRSRARALLEHAGYDVVGEAADATRALDQARALGPDVILLDVQLPDRDGISVAGELSALPDPPRVVLISSRQAEDYGSRLKGAPAAGFIHKPELSRASLRRVIGAPG